MAGFIELDKPSTAPIAADSSDDDIQVGDARIGGRQGALLRDPDGHVAYPTFIPPNVDSPTSPKATDPIGLSESAKTPDAPAPRKSQTEPFPVVETESADEGAQKLSRPSFEGKRKFQTEAPRYVGRDVSSFPPVQRAGTNVSLPNRTSAHDQTDDSSSSSDDDDDDDDEGQQQARGAKPTRMGAEDKYRRFRIANDNYHTKGRVSKRDGRLNITVNDTSNTGYLAKALGSAVKKVVPPTGKAANRSGPAERPTPTRLSSTTTATSENVRRPSLNIVIMVIGSRGDAQPFLKIGKELKEKHGHRVRIATHPAFREFVEKDSGLEFFSVGGDPSELMAFMVKNPGMIPKLETVKAGDIGRRRAAMAEMFDGFWRACINATDNEKDTHNLKMMGAKTPFVADAIIANPPSFAHLHCAEALGIPLHLMFTFPYTPTQAFPHPLASIKKSNVDPGYTNFMSYPLVEMMVWQGLGDLVNDFRVKTLGLDPVSTLWAPGSTYRLHVPFTYLWSPGLVPKPEDWGDEIDISGFVFLDLASTFKPPQELTKFLDAGEPPIYIGFGSIVVDDADKFTEMIFEAVKKAGVRALVSKGWGGLGQDNVPDNIFMLENTPHDWLFPKIRAAVIHGGAGTTAIALKCGIPTMIVPFFGDQNFWGSMVASAGAGPEPVPYKKLNVDRLAEGIKFCLTEEALQGAQTIAKDIELEGDGAKNAVRSFHHHLNLSGEKSMRCSILSDRVAVWNVKDTSLKLSGLATDVLVEKGYLHWRKLRLIRHREWNDFEGPGEPFTGAAGSIMSTVGEFFGGFGSVPYRLAKTSNKRTERKKKKEEKRKRRLERKKKAAESKPLANLDAKPDANPDANAETAPNKSTSAGFPFPQETAVKDQQPGVMTRRPNEARRATNATDVSSLLTGTPGTGPPTANAAEEYVNEVSEGIGQSGRAIARAPIDLSMAIAQGFHNAPRLYGDDTVRKPIRVTGMRSGLRAARSEFVYGIYDGFTGVVKLPIKGAREGGVRGAMAGVGMGIGGFVLKDIAAFVAPVGYTLKGIAKEVERSRQPTKYIRRTRIVQAQREMQSLSPEDKKALCEEVYKGWDVMRQLGDVIMVENRKRGIIGRLEHGGGRNGKKGKHMGKWGKGRAFESVTVAAKAIAAVKGGDNVDSVLGANPTPDARKSADTRKSGERTAAEQDAIASKGEVEAKVGQVAERNAAHDVKEDDDPKAVPARKKDPSPLEVN